MRESTDGAGGAQERIDPETLSRVGRTRECDRCSGRRIGEITLTGPYSFLCPDRGWRHPGRAPYRASSARRRGSGGPSVNRAWRAQPDISPCLALRAAWISSRSCSRTPFVRPERMVCFLHRDSRLDETERRGLVVGHQAQVASQGEDRPHAERHAVDGGDEDLLAGVHPPECPVGLRSCQRIPERCSAEQPAEPPNPLPGQQERGPGGRTSGTERCGPRARDRERCSGSRTGRCR